MKAFWLQKSLPVPSRGLFSGALVSLALLSGACGDPIKYGQKLENPRVIGVRVATAEDAATPSPGEEITVAVLVVGPDGPVVAEFEHTLCEAADSATGVPFCAREPIFTGPMQGDTAPRVAVTVPEEVPFGTRLAALFVGCTEGTPSFAPEPQDWACTSGEPPLSASFDALVARSAEEKNHNPDLTDLVVAVDGEDAPLTIESQPPACADAVSVGEGETVKIEFQLSDAAREELPDGETEVLTLSHFSTTGLYETQYTFIDPPEDARTDLEFEAPEEPGPSQHYVVVRDDRGGVAWRTFDVCVAE